MSGRRGLTKREIKQAIKDYKARDDAPRDVISARERYRRARDSIQWKRANGSITPVIEIEGQKCDLSHTAVDSYLTADPMNRFAAMRTALISSIMRGTRSGAPYGESQMLRDLAVMLEEAGEGNYASPPWPKRSSDPGRKTTHLRRRAEAAILVLIELKERLDNRQPSPEKRLAISSAVATSLDTVLLQHKSLKRCSEALNRLGGALAYWANGYESRDRKPGRSPDGAQDLHCMANRFVSWFDQPIASSDELRRHRQEARDLEEYHEQSVADIYAQLMGAAVDWVLVSFKSAPPNNPQAEQSESVNLNNPL